MNIIKTEVNPKWTLAAFVGTQIFDEISIIFVVPAATYALIMMITSIFFILIIKKIHRKIQAIKKLVKLNFVFIFN